MTIRKFVLCLNSIAAVFFAIFLAYTFFARAHVNGMASEFVTEKTLKYSEPLVELAEDALDVRLVRTLLGKERVAAYCKEIEKYHEDAAAYIGDLTQSQLSKEEEPIPDNPILAKIAGLKQKIRDYYHQTLQALIIDLRIFSFSNLVACLFAGFLAWRSPPRLPSELTGISIGIFILVAYSSWLYIDGLSFFRILFQAHLGWWYPIVMILVMLWPLSSHLRLTAGTNASGKANSFDEFAKGKELPEIDKGDSED